MSADQFTYWLQGFFEISQSSTLTESQIEVIKDHLNLVFNKVTPNRVLQDIRDITFDSYNKRLCTTSEPLSDCKILEWPFNPYCASC